jgi:hypothetical protein
MSKDLREQLGSAIDTATRLRERVEMVKNKLLFHVDQGDGLTQEQLVEVYAEIAKLFPRRVRKASDSLDVPL